jgi:hypothetical protein
MYLADVGPFLPMWSTHTQPSSPGGRCTSRKPSLDASSFNTRPMTSRACTTPLPPALVEPDSLSISRAFEGERGVRDVDCSISSPAFRASGCIVWMQRTCGLEMIRAGFNGPIRPARLHVRVTVR